MRKDITEQFTDLQSALEKFQQNVKKDIEEIRSQKDEIQRIKQDIFDNLEKGRYIREMWTKAVYYGVEVQRLSYGQPTSIWKG